MYHFVVSIGYGFHNSLTERGVGVDCTGTLTMDFTVLSKSLQYGSRPTS